MAARLARFEIKKVVRRGGKPPEWYWRLLAGNGECLCHGERHPSVNNARRAMLRVMDLLASRKVEFPV